MDTYFIESIALSFSCQTVRWNLEDKSVQQEDKCLNLETMSDKSLVYLESRGGCRDNSGQ